MKGKNAQLHQRTKFYLSKAPGCYGLLAERFPWLSLIVTKRYEKRVVQDWAGNKKEYFQKKLDQTTGTLYQKSPVSLDGVLEMRIASEKKKKACFLTTACTEARGLPDDCFELRVLRDFRDGYLLELPNGSQLIAEYYAIAPQLVARIAQHPSANAILENIYATVCTAVEQILRRDNQAALRTYSQMVRGLIGSL